MNRLPASNPATPRQAHGHADVSVLVPVLNEERHIREAVAAMRAQGFDGTIELLFADGGSTDATPEILRELAAGDSRIRVLDNPRRRTASGLNVCLGAASGEFVARMDAHTIYADGYLAAGVERLRRGDADWVSGPAIPRPVGAVSHAVAAALTSWLGRGDSRKWGDALASGQEWELDSGVFGGVWRRSELLEMGGWDERWPINQDSEMASRFLARGARLVCLREMAAHYVPRDSLARLALQYYRYGFYRAQTFRRHPLSMRRSHLTAPALAAALIATVAGPRALRRAARFGICGYAGAVASTGLNLAVRNGRPVEGALLLAVLPTMHFSWGFGTLAGVLRFGPPIAALKRVTFGSTDATLEERADAVYAPSLNDEPRRA